MSELAVTYFMKETIPKCTLGLGLCSCGLLLKFDPYKRRLLDWLWPTLQIRPLPKAYVNDCCVALTYFTNGTLIKDVCSCVVLFVGYAKRFLACELRVSVSAEVSPIARASVFDKTLYFRFCFLECALCLWDLAGVWGYVCLNLPKKYEYFQLRSLICTWLILLYT